MASKKTAVLWAVLAAALYALNSPISKLLLGKIPPTIMAALLYLGAGIGLSIMRLVPVSYTHLTLPTNSLV